MKVLFIFAGQGYLKDDLFAVIDTDDSGKHRANDFLKRADLNTSITETQLADPQYTQLLIGAYQWTMYHEVCDFFTDDNLFFAGYSLGEVMALLTSIKATTTDAVSAIQYRTKLMLSEVLQNESYDLLSIKGRFSISDVKRCCQQNHCNIAIRNSDSHFIVGGEVSSLKQLIDDLKHAHLEHYRFLSICLPSHTPFYEHCRDKLSDFLLKKYKDSPLSIPILNPLLLSKVYTSEEEIKLLDKELYTTLDWYSVCLLIKENNFDLIIDLGPGAAMTSLLKAACPSIADNKILTLANFKTLTGIRNHIKA